MAEQTHLPDEVILVDDCSPEPVVAPGHLPFTSKVVRHLRNQGPGASRNTGLAHATGDWIIFLDDDDLLTPHRLQLAINGMGSTRAHVCDVEWFDSQNQTLPRSSPAYSGDVRVTFTHGPPPFLGQVVFHREDLLQFDPTLRVAEDTEWWVRMSDRAHFSWSPTVGLRYRSHEETRTGVRDDTRYRARRQVAVRHAPRADRTTRARLYSNVGAEALLMGRRASAASWLVRSLASRPTELALKRLARCVLPL